MPEPRTVVLVGHCGPDMHMLKSAVMRAVPGARVVTVNDAASLEKHLTKENVLLINRVLDGGFTGESGVELIHDIARRPDPPMMMLISNYHDAQEQAVSAGAQRGFGKLQLYNESTVAMLREAVSGSESQTGE